MVWYNANMTIESILEQFIFPVLFFHVVTKVDNKEESLNKGLLK